MVFGKKAKAKKSKESLDNLKQAATEWNKKTPAEKKAARKWGGKKKK